MKFDPSTKEMYDVYTTLNPLDFGNYHIPYSTKLDIEAYYYHRIDPDPFLGYILCKNYIDSYREASLINEILFDEIVKWFENNMPKMAWGSEEVVNSWINGTAFG